MVGAGVRIDWTTLQRQLRCAGQRRLVLVEGARHEALAWLAGQLPQLAYNTGLWVGPEADAPADSLTALAPTQALRWLGRESDLLVWDGWAGNPPDSLAALSGTLAAGGLWFWLVPPLERWPGFDDPDYHRTGLAAASTHPFARRLARLLAEDDQVIRVCPEEGGVSLPRVPCPEPFFAVGTSAEQRQLVEDVVRVGMGRRRRPLVVTADRGRGKSTALGMAAIQLLRQGRHHIAVTAPAAPAVATLFRHARLAAGDELDTAASSETQLVLVGGGSLRFYPRDELLAQRPPAELVLVDEAAAIPASQLQTILLGWPRCVFASTIHGYEGSGRGFAIRFRAVLERETPHWRQRHLRQPIRWAGDDPLEALTARLFLLNASAPAVDNPQAPIRVEPWQPSSASEAELNAAFGLLVDAHYRTAPADLRQWLDDPQALSWRLWCGDQLAGVLWATEEGGLSTSLAAEVMAGRRRLRGHLLPQSLANHSGFAEAATMKMLRVVRVAVTDGCRRRGLGQQLVAAALAHARSNGFDAVGTSYGASPGLLAFWHRSGLPLVRLGLHREASSGEFTVQMLAGLSADGQLLERSLRRRFGDHWLTLLPAVWPTLEPELALALTGLLPAGAELGPDDERELRAFADGYRGFELSLPVLRLLTRQHGVARTLWQGGDAIGGDRRGEGALWCRAVLQGWDWSRLQAAGVCRGRRDGEDRLRLLAAELLKNR